MKLEAYLYTTPGGRPDNADYRIEADQGLFVLADGLGGRQTGGSASALVVRSLVSMWGKRRRKRFSASSLKNGLAPWLRGRVLAANQTLLAAQRDQRTEMKSTALALAMNGRQAAWCHVGDSRLYYLTGGVVFHATQDHTVAYRKFLEGKISSEEISSDKDRGTLLRMMGDELRCLPEAGGREHGDQISQGDAFLLCSNGFWEYLRDDEILEDFLQSETPAQWADLLLQRVRPRMTPDSDNLTFLAVFLT